MDKEFEKIFQTLCYGKNAQDVWNDFVAISAATISYPFDFRQEKEVMIKRILDKYSPDKRSLFTQLFAQTITALEENPHQDYLGNMFMKFGFGDRRAGQFFTPYCVAEAMAALTINQTEMEKSYITLNDPCCGSGCMIIASFHQVAKTKKNPHFELFCVGNDISFPIAMMCYIQMSLLGVAGYVTVEDSLKKPLTGSAGNVLTAPKEAWCTPLYYHKIWRTRQFLCDLEKI